MKPDASHIQKILVVSNTHWDREFRRSFEKTRRRLLDMLDVTLDILEKEPEYHSFTMDGHAILIDDYLEMRPERRASVEKLVKAGRLIIGPYYTLCEEFSVAGEALVRNLAFGRETVAKYGGRTGTVAYTPSSWGQTGQLPQILADFGLEKMMFYRGISHHEADAEWIWAAPDGTQVLASRFALYARYNWYYQVHRPVTTGRVFGKDYVWGEFDEAPFRPADGLSGEDLTFDLRRPAALYNKSRLKQAIEDMVRAEGAHFTTPVFLAMHGHDISVAVPNEVQVIRDARALFAGRYDIRHANLEEFWNEAEKHLDRSALPVLVGERRSYLKQGMWTFLFPGTISSRTYLKQKDFEATRRLVKLAEPLAALACGCGADAPLAYLKRGWQSLLSNHTHDANGGCAPDAVCLDMEYRYRVAADVGDIVAEDAMAHVAANLTPEGQDAKAMQLIVFNPLPRSRDAVVLVDVEIPREHAAKSVGLSSPSDADVLCQPVSNGKSSSFVDSIWEVPRILESNRVKFHALLRNLPALGYRTYALRPSPTEVWHNQTLLTGPRSMENEWLAVTVNDNGTIDLTCKSTGRQYPGLNYLMDQGETGNAWKHVPPTFDRVFTSLGARANVFVQESGPVVTTIVASYRFAAPQDYGDGTTRSETLVEIPVRVEYRLEAGSRCLGITLSLDNTAHDHWLRACLPSGLQTDISVADTHFDVVTRPIALPDSSEWAERAFGTHPLATFVDLSDGRDGLAVLPKGLFEYEVLDTSARPLVLTLLRACRIKLAVSEEKLTELPDAGIQCPGPQRFEYAICPHAGDWLEAGLLAQADETSSPVRAAQIGRGQGTLPLESTFLIVDSDALHVTAVKPAADGTGVIVRLFNPTAVPVAAALVFGMPLRTAARCTMDEVNAESLPVAGGRLSITVEPKKIRTYRVTW